MNIRKIIILIFIIVLAINSVLYILIRDNNEAEINIVEVNDVAETLAKNWDVIGNSELPGLNYGFDYVILDNSNNFIAATKDGLNTDYNLAVSNRDTIYDIKTDDLVLGKLIIYNNTSKYWSEYKLYLFIYVVSSIIFLGFLCFLYALYINKTVIYPFKKLQKFAKQVSEGNLDIPLEMDRGNKFGAFTESFDLMREELKKARENERAANQSKKELVAQLSHDIKTPVASIKAVSEIMSAKTHDENEKRQLEIIDSKADQINTLITNLFNATLEELQELKVTVTEQPSLILYDLIKKADYNHQVTVAGNAECLVLMDVLRLSQVIDNVISNSYKYAGTSISISLFIADKYLMIDFRDYGKGVSQDELPLLFNKFYRGSNSANKSGTGLGLYTSKYLMKKMNGDITCKNVNDGFIMTLKLRLA